jgi:predicted ATPase/DNA-binding SARP family transcriptional activator
VEGAGPQPALRLLGGVRWRSPRGWSAATGGKARAVLAALGLRIGQAVMVDQLIDDVWGEHPPATARNTVQVYVSAARRGLQAAGSPLRVESLSGGYALAGSPEQVDWFLFEALVTQGRVAARGGDHDRARQLLTEALALWEGPPLADVGDAPLRAVFAPAMTAARLVALADRFDADLALGDADVLAELAPVAEANPLDERLAGQLLLALHRAGRRTDALRHYETLRETFAAETGGEPGTRLRELYRAIHDEEPGLDAAPPPVPAPGGTVVAAGRATQPGDELVGRVDELERAAALLREHRFLTLVGPPGVGKSRLAAELVAARRADGVATWTVGVDGVAGADLLADAVVAAAGVGGAPGRDPVERLRSHLLGRRALVVLDNAEHLTEAVAALARALLADRPQLAVLVTSRQPLHDPAEGVLRLDPLPVPPPDAVTAADLAGVDSVALFCARVRAMQPGFELTDATAPAVAEICRTLDGLPLAIELAGARTRILTTGDLAARLDDQLGVLTARRAEPGDRHGSLRSALEASVSPLPADRREWFARLSVFSGGFTIDAAEALADDVPGPAAPGAGPAQAGDDVLDVLHDLVDQSLVVADVSAEATRFHLLEAVRQFGGSLLGPADAAAARRRHGGYYLELARTAAEERRGPRRAAWRARLAAERPNLHAAIDRALADDRLPTALELAALLWWTWTNTPREGVVWYRRVLAAAVRPGSGPLPEVLPTLLGAAVVASYVSHEEAMGHARQAYLVALAAGDQPGLARALQHVSDIALEAGDIDQARQAGDEALLLATDLGDPYGIGRCRLTIAYNHLGEDGLTDARRWAELAAESFRGCRDDAGVADAQLVVAETLIDDGPAGAAEKVLDEALATLRAAGNEQQVARAATLSALVLARAGRRADGAYLVREAFDIHAVIGHPWSIAHDLDVVARLRADLGDAAGAAALLAAAGQVRADAGLTPLRRDRAVRSAVERRCRADLGAAGYRAASGKGAGLDLDAAVALARATS